MNTPGLAAIRAKTSELGTGPMLINMARQTIRPRGVALAIATCLDPAHLALNESLSELVTAGLPLLHPAGNDQHDPERYMATWLSFIRETSIHGQTDI